MVRVIHNQLEIEVIEMGKVALLAMLIMILNPQAIVTTVDNVITIDRDNVIKTIVVNE